MTYSVDDCRIINLPKISDPRGNLTFIEENEHVPFPIARVYYLYDVPGGASRAGHAHHELEQFLIAASGSFTVVIDDGRTKKEFFLNRSWYGLYIAPMIWREIVDFSSGSICLSLASAPYDESDYIREHEDFLEIRRRTT
jgi:dTDP-4-dehydrorhamnose 3,5-epimerase-like enzyme